MATSGPMVSSVAKTAVKVEKIMAPFARFAASQTKPDFRNAAQQSVILVPSFPPASPEDFFSSENERKPHRAKALFIRRKKDFHLNPIIELRGRGEPLLNVTMDRRPQAARSG